MPTTLVKQIAGRAGRRSSAYPQGYVTCLEPEEAGALRAAIDLPNSAMVTHVAGLTPEFEQIELLAGQRPGAKLEGAPRSRLPCALFEVSVQF